MNLDNTISTPLYKQLEYGGCARKSKTASCRQGAASPPKTS